MALETRLFVGNLPENADEHGLRSAFSQYGEITNFELKSKSAEDASKKFAFITLSATHYDVESCLKHFSSEDFKGSRLYVTKARESFLERLQRERQQAQEKEKEKLNNHAASPSKKHPVLKLSEKFNPRKRKPELQINGHDNEIKLTKVQKTKQVPEKIEPKIVEPKVLNEVDKKKLDSEKKRLESMKRKRQDFKDKQMIIKTGLVGVDKVQNKKIIFSDSDNEQETKAKSQKSFQVSKKQKKDASLFDDDEGSDAEVNFEIKKQYEGKKGQKVLELQSRYKSDKRFMLDERFIDDDAEEEGEQNVNQQSDEIHVSQVDEKDKQLNILQDVLGVTIKRSSRTDDGQDKKMKPRLGGMLRFDPLQPEHSKFLAPVDDTKQETSKKSKKKKKEQADESMDTTEPDPPREIEKVEASKEQFYKVSETLKEAIAQPNMFSLRSLFKGNDDDNEKDTAVEESFIALEKKKELKVKNPLDRTDTNPFKYDSSESESEDEPDTKEETLPQGEVKAVWRENLFFKENDVRLTEGLSFFNKADSGIQKERREMKSVMKKRLFNKDKKDQMFKKKIGGRRKTQKKHNRRRN